jgi:predicted dehydrogenase
VIDLGIHLVDLVLSTLDWPQVVDVDSRLVHHRGCGVEDYAAARLELDSGAIVSLACSWHLQAGRDCVIECRFHGTDGGAAVRNVDGSFYDLRAERYHGTATEGIVDPPDDWGARPIREWAEALTAGAGYDPAVECVLDVHEAIDRIYGRSG